MKKFLTGAILFSGILGFAAGASAVENADASANSKTVIDQAETTVEVEGTLGMDNTDPGAEIPEGDKKWVNVTVPMKTIFYSVGTSTDIGSPSYTITNNSGRPVTVTAESFASKAAGALTGVKSLNVKLDVKDGSSVDVIKANATGSEANVGIDSPAILGELANSDGQLVRDGAADLTKTSLEFGYSGSYTATDLTGAVPVSETFDLGLKFAPTVWAAE